MADIRAVWDIRYGLLLDISGALMAGNPEHQMKSRRGWLVVVGSRYW
jgi:hypothetical protein